MNSIRLYFGFLMTVSFLNPSFAQDNSLKGVWEIREVKIQCVSDGRVVADANPIEHYAGSYLFFDCIFGPGSFAETGVDWYEPNTYVLRADEGKIEIFRFRLPDQVNSYDRPNSIYYYDIAGPTISAGPHYEPRKECPSTGNNALVTYYSKWKMSCR